MNASDSSLVSENPQPSPRLIIFDLDGTLAPYLSEKLYSDSLSWLVEHGHEQALALCSNQGGVGLRYWMETNHFGKAEEIEKLPTLKDIRERMFKIIKQFPQPLRAGVQLFACYAYQSRRSGKWSPTPEGMEDRGGWKQDWRKPAPGMLLAAIQKAGVEPEQTLMVGDTDDDLEASVAAGCGFQWAYEFFGRPVPVAEGTPDQ